MSERNKAYAYFFVKGRFEPDDLTRQVGIGPTRCWRSGEPMRNGSNYSHSHWALHSMLDDAQPLENHISDVLDQMDANAANFAAIARDYSGTMQLVGYFNEYYPGLSFDAKLVGRLARYGLSVDFDFYGLASPANSARRII